MCIFPVDPLYRNIVDEIIRKEWGGPVSVSVGALIDTRKIPGFVFIENDRVVGAVTYCVRDDACEIVTLNSYAEDKGIGTALIDAVADMAKSHGCQRLWLITTNDNTRAIRFYQKRGFSLAAVHLNSMDVSRRLKPSIPLIGVDSIPLQHEFEFEKMLIET